MDALLENANSLPGTPMDCDNSKTEVKAAPIGEPMEEVPSSNEGHDGEIVLLEEAVTNESNETVNDEAPSSNAPVLECGEMLMEESDTTLNKDLPSQAKEIDEQAMETGNSLDTKSASQPKACTVGATPVTQSSASTASQNSSATPKSGDQAKPPWMNQLSTFTKTILLPQSTPSSGKVVNIQIMSKDQKTLKKVTVAPNVKRLVIPNELKRVPLILPKSANKASPSPTPAKNLHQVVVPNNYVLVQTGTGLSFMPADQVPNGAIKPAEPKTKHVRTSAGFKNVNVLNTTQSSSVGIANVPLNKTPLSALKMPPLMFTTPGVGSASQASGQKPRVTTQSLQPPVTQYCTQLAAMDGCRHPVCTQYRETLLDELRVRIHMRDRKIKSARMGRERSVRRAANHAQTLKRLERQRSVLTSLQFFPDGLCKTLMKAQLKPNQDVRIKRLYEEDVNSFVTGLHMISPKAYDIVRKVFNKVLPDPKKIDTWTFSRTEVTVAESTPPEKAGNSGEEEDSDSDSDGQDEMGEEDL